MPKSIILQLRERRQLTQEEVAELIGVTRGRVAQVEIGMGNFDRPILLRICEVFQEDLEALDITDLDVMRGHLERRRRRTATA